jgi:hypothetical protein
MMEATDLIKTLLEGFKAVAKTETIVGDGIKAGEFTILPVSADRPPSKTLQSNHIFMGVDCYHIELDSWEGFEIQRLIFIKVPM